MFTALRGSVVGCGAPRGSCSSVVVYLLISHETSTSFPASSRFTRSLISEGICSVGSGGGVCVFRHLRGRDDIRGGSVCGGVRGKVLSVRRVVPRALDSS